MSIREWIDIFAIALGAGLMLIAIRRAWGMRSAVQSAGYCNLLRVLLVLMKLFLIGYLFSLWCILADHVDWLRAIVAQVFLFGSVFVVLTTWLAQRTSDQLLKYSQHLEQLVAERTEHLRKALQEQERAKSHMSQLFEGMPVACFTYDREGIVRDWNKEAEQLYGYSAEEVAGRSIYDILCSPEDVPRIRQVIDWVFSGQELRNLEWEDRTRTGERRWVLCSTFPILDPNGAVVGAISANVDITARKKQDEIIEAQRAELEAQNESLQQITQQLALANAELEKIAATDALTGLPNHRVFRERLWREFLWSLEHDKPLSLILLDVDHFKRFNDTFGHQAGDEVLCKVANTLRETSGEEFFCARYGGEEFVVILPGLDRAQGMAFAERLRQAVEETPCCYQPITISLGVATLDLHTLNPESLVEEADQALYISKRNGRNRATHASEAGVLVTQIAPEVWEDRVQTAIREGGGYATQQVISQIIYDHLQIVRRARALVLGSASAQVSPEEPCRFLRWLEYAQKAPGQAGADLSSVAELHERFCGLYRQIQAQPDPQTLNSLARCGREFIGAFQPQLATFGRAA